MKKFLISSFMLMFLSPFAHAGALTLACYEDVLKGQKNTPVTSFRIELKDNVSTVNKFDSYAEMMSNENVQESHKVKPIINESSLNGYLVIQTNTYLLEYDAEDALVINIIGGSFVNALHINTDTGGVLHKLQCDLLN